MTFKEALRVVAHGLPWVTLKHEDKETAELMEHIAPAFVSQTIKLSKTRHIQAQSSAKRKTK